MRRISGAFVLVVWLVSGMLGVLVTPALGAGVPGVFYSGNQTCGSLGGWAEIARFDPPVDGTRNGVTVDFDTSPEPHSFSFTSTVQISSVFVKAADGGLLYTYNPPVTGDTGLTGGEKNAISHVSFCVPPPSTPTHTPTSTPTSTATSTASSTPTSTPTSIPTNTPTSAPSPSPSPSETNTPAASATATPQPTGQPHQGNDVHTPTPVRTPSPTPTIVPSLTPTLMPTPILGVVFHAVSTSAITASPVEVPIVTPAPEVIEEVAGVPVGEEFLGGGDHDVVPTPEAAPTARPTPTLPVTVMPVTGGVREGGSNVWPILVGSVIFSGAGLLLMGRGAATERN